MESETGRRDMLKRVLSLTGLATSSNARRIQYTLLPIVIETLFLQVEHQSIFA